MTRFLDELARSMARPMPRSRALRLLGGAVVSAAAAGVLGKGSGAAVKPGRRAAAPQEPVCFESTSVETGCGYMPLPFNCPRQDRAGGDPCGPYAHPDCCLPGWHCCSDGPPRADPDDTLLGCPGGAVDYDGNYCCPNSCDCYKGACCPRGGKRGADKGHPICCEPGKDILNGRCVEKTCGPDVTSGLKDVLSRTRAAFGGWSSLERAVACTTLVQSPIGAAGWEINQLGPGGRDKVAERYQPDCATCGASLSVQVGSGCHYSGSVNYVVYGVMLRLCHDHLESKRSSLASTYSEESMALYVTIWKKLRGAPNLRASLAWAKAGYNGWPKNGSIPRPELPNCAECPRQTAPHLTVRWLPLGLNI